MRLAAIRKLVSVHWGIVCLLCMGVFAQGAPRPKFAPTWLSEAPRQQIVVGYSYLRISGAQVNNLPIGFLLDSNFFFSRHFGLQIESASHWATMPASVRWKLARYCAFLQGALPRLCTQISDTRV